MDILEPSASAAIKSKPPRNVKALLPIAILSIALAFGSFSSADAQDAPDPPPDLPDANNPVENPPPPPPEAGGMESTTNSGNENLPKIAAREYQIKIIRKSKSKRVYLLSTLGSELPAEGRILLLRTQSKVPAMAFRVLKVYPENQEIAAKWIRKYAGRQTLDDDTEFRALEKLHDLAPPPPPTVQDRRDLNELEGETSNTKPTEMPLVDNDKPPAEEKGLEDLPPEDDLPPENAPALKQKRPVPYDPELDAEGSPPPKGAADSRRETENPFETESEEEGYGITVQEVFPIDRNPHWLSLGFGMLRNNRAPDAGSEDGTSRGSSYWSGAGIRYGITLSQMPFLRRPRIQDSLVFDAGIYLYKILNYSFDSQGNSNGDTYTVMPIIGTLRYNILLSESFGFFTYGGIMWNRILSSAQPQDVGLQLLNSVFPALGVGLLFRVGPNWDARVDAGTDMLGAGLVLRF